MQTADSTGAAEGPQGTVQGLGSSADKCCENGCRATLLVGHRFLVLLFHDIDRSSHAASEMR